MSRRDRIVSRTWQQSAVLAVVIVVSMVLGGILAVTVTDDGDDSGAPFVGASATAETPPSTSSPQPASDTGAPSSGSTDELSAIEDLPRLVRDVSPSVVLIRTSGAGVSGQGSGVVIDRSGHILTNLHVVQGGTSYSVQLFDGTVADATVVGTDPGNDLAVLLADIPSQLLQPAIFGDSDAVRVGESVFAVGSPFSLEFTVTSGIISGVNRESRATAAGRPIRGVLQTDAAVNAGNSGGPLFNARGEVIGINTAVENPVGQNFFVGVGYAVPSNTALRFIPDMIAGVTIKHAQLGVSGVSLNSLNADDADVDVIRGVYITVVAPGSAADRSGLTPATIRDGGELDRGGDVILKIDGQEVGSVQELARIIDRHDVGEIVTLTVLRDGREISIDATLLEWPS